MAAAQDPSFQPILLTLPSLTPSLALEVCLQAPSIIVRHTLLLQIIPHGLILHRLFVQADGKVRTLLQPLTAHTDTLTDTRHPDWP